MKFKEAFGLYMQNVDVRVPLCNEHKTNLYDDLIELNQMPDVDRTRLEYYKLYLESCGDLDKPRKPFICFGIYLNIYAHVFEPDLRRNLINRRDTNEIHCRIFNIPQRYYGMTFDNIQKIPEQQQIIQTAWNWIKGGWKDSLLLGSKVPGIGKTNTLACTGMQRFVEYDFTEIKRFEGNLEFLNSSIIFIKERELVAILNNPGIYRGMIIDRLASVDYLMYDDMFSVGDNKFAKEVLMPLMDDRIDSFGKPTAVSTRLPHENLKRHYADLYSRFSRGKIYYSDSKKDLRQNG